MKVIRTPDDLEGDRCIITTNLSTLVAENTKFCCKPIEREAFDSKWEHDKLAKETAIIAQTVHEKEELEERFGRRGWFPSYYFVDKTVKVRRDDTIYLLQRGQLTPQERSLNSIRERREQIVAPFDAYEVFLFKFDPIDG